MKLKPKTVKMLRRIIKEILKEPRQFDMTHYFTEDAAFVDKIPNCGTAGCIAGWALAIKRGNPKKAEEWIYSDPLAGSERAEASAVLGMTFDHAKPLFYTNDWPESYRLAYNACEFSPRLRALVTAERIEHFIKSGGRG